MTFGNSLHRVFNCASLCCGLCCFSVLLPDSVFLSPFRSLLSPVSHFSSLFFPFSFDAFLTLFSCHSAVWVPLQLSSLFVSLPTLSLLQGTHFLLSPPPLSPSLLSCQLVCKMQNLKKLYVSLYEEEAAAGIRWIWVVGAPTALVPFLNVVSLDFDVYQNAFYTLSGILHSTAVKAGSNSHPIIL